MDIEAQIKRCLLDAQQAEVGISVLADDVNKLNREAFRLAETLVEQYKNSEKDSELILTNKAVEAHGLAGEVLHKLDVVRELVEKLTNVLIEAKEQYTLAH